MTVLRHGFHHRRPWHVHKASLSWPCSSCAPPTPTTGCRNSSGTSSTSSLRRSRSSCFPPRAAPAADGLVMGDGAKEAQTHTRRQRGCCSGCQYSRSGCTTVGPWDRHRPCRLCSSVSHKAPQREPGRSVFTSITRLAWAEPTGSGTRMTNFCVASQPMLLIASRKPHLKYGRAARRPPPGRLSATAQMDQRLLEFLTTLTLRALHRHKHVHDSSNHSLYLIQLFNSSSPEGHCGGNQPPDGSSCLSPPKPKYYERIARQILSMMFGPRSL